MPRSYFYSLPYVLIFVILSFLCIPITANNRKLNEEFKKINIIYAFIILFLFIGLRGFIRSDWLSYYPCFMDAPTIFDSSEKIISFFTKGEWASWEKGYLLFNVLSKSFIPYWGAFQALSFTIDFIIAVYFIKSFVPKHVSLGICFYYTFGCLTYDINLFRNSKAIMLFILSLKYATDRKFLYYFLLNLLGTFFHISAVIFIPLYFILDKKASPRFLWSLFFVSVVFFVLKIRWVSTILALLSGFVGGRLGQMLKIYLESELWSSGYGLNIGFLKRIFTFIVFMHYRERLLNNKYNIAIYNCYFLYFFTYMFLSEMSVLTDRIPIMFIFAYWVIYPQIYEYLNKNLKMIFLTIFVMFLSSILLMKYTGMDNMYDNLLFQKYSVSQRTVWENRMLEESMKNRLKNNKGK